ncbi:unnamed protein product [Dibothriocephalus latus]|uniref:Uncharacterized protein n=1 Tax=Dibothriocephalus latus TaxID=60516 RepID=A0A3P7NM23_DIBLA|nr:unnamed protein product [Dibothriocephalus latus]
MMGEEFYDWFRHIPSPHTGFPSCSVSPAGLLHPTVSLQQRSAALPNLAPVSPPRASSIETDSLAYWENAFLFLRSYMPYLLNALPPSVSSLNSTDNDLKLGSITSPVLNNLSPLEQPPTGAQNGEAVAPPAHLGNPKLPTYDAPPTLSLQSSLVEKKVAKEQEVGEPYGISLTKKAEYVRAENGPSARKRPRFGIANLLDVPETQEAQENELCKAEKKEQEDRGTMLTPPRSQQKQEVNINGSPSFVPRLPDQRVVVNQILFTCMTWLSTSRPNQALVQDTLPALTDMELAQLMAQSWPQLFLTGLVEQLYSTTVKTSLTATEEELRQHLQDLNTDKFKSWRQRARKGVLQHADSLERGRFLLDCYQHIWLVTQTPGTQTLFQVLFKGTFHCVGEELQRLIAQMTFVAMEAAQSTLRG